MARSLKLWLGVGLGVLALTVACGSATATPASELRYDPSGPDRDCGDFRTWQEAQDFFIAAGGPERDPHWLDGDQDGIACEALR